MLFPLRLTHLNDCYKPKVVETFQVRKTQELWPLRFILGRLDEFSLVSCHFSIATVDFSE